MDTKKNQSKPKGDGSFISQHHASKNQKKLQHLHSPIPSSPAGYAEMMGKNIGWERLRYMATTLATASDHSRQYGFWSSVAGYANKRIK